MHICLVATERRPPHFELYGYIRRHYDNKDRRLRMALALRGKLPHTYLKIQQQDTTARRTWHSNGRLEGMGFPPALYIKHTARQASRARTGGRLSAVLDCCWNRENKLRARSCRIRTASVVVSVGLQSPRFGSTGGERSNRTITSCCVFFFAPLRASHQRRSKMFKATFYPQVNDHFLLCVFFRSSSRVKPTPQ